ncbi:MAG: tetratricopeptide repeat protein [Thermoguttaceae bacterium]|nr:tetratricopeptide repeat protein [Thermoguttaceae bacterium]
MGYSIRGRLYAESGRWDDALPDYNKALEIDVNFYPAYKNRGVYFKNMGQWDEALKDFDRAISLFDKDPSVFFERAGVYLKLDRKEEYEADMAKVNELDPDFLNSDRATRSSAPAPVNPEPETESAAPEAPAEAPVEPEPAAEPEPELPAEPQPEAEPALELPAEPQPEAEAPILELPDAE